MIERVFAAIALLACLVLLVRLTMGEPRRYRFDSWVGRRWHALRVRGLAIWHWRDARRAVAAARQAADDAIRRARDRGEWDGNVYRPKAFRKPPRDKMH